VAAAQLPLDEIARGAVEVIEHLGVLQERVLRRQLLELRHADEMVFAPVALVRAARARGVRDRQPQPGLALKQGVDEGGLARAGGGGDHEQPAALHGAGI
jgi:predicted alpha-1,6-mannanase (GH76 family)